MKYQAIVFLMMAILSTSVFAEYKKPQTPMELHDLFSVYYVEKDLKGIMTLFHEDAVFVKNAKGDIARGKKEIANEIKPYLSAEGSMENLTTKVYINDDIALIKGTWRIAGTNSKNEIGGEAIEVMKYENGGWLYLIDNPNGF